MEKTLYEVSKPLEEFTENRAEFRDNSVFRYHKVKIDTFGHFRSEVSWTFEGLEIERCIIN